MKERKGDRRCWWHHIFLSWGGACRGSSPAPSRPNGSIPKAMVQWRQTLGAAGNPEPRHPHINTG